MAAPIDDFVGQYKASCGGTGPNKLSGKWQWELKTSHTDEDGNADPDSISVNDVSLNPDGIWVVTFRAVNKGPIETVEGEVNVTKYSSTLKDYTLQGSLDSFAYASPSRPLPPVFQAHWNATLVKGREVGSFTLDYRGYNAKDDPDYNFTCDLYPE